MDLPHMIIGSLHSLEIPLQHISETKLSNVRKVWFKTAYSNAPDPYH
jgi:hypothetical protein